MDQAQNNSLAFEKNKKGKVTFYPSIGKLMFSEGKYTMESIAVTRMIPFAWWEVLLKCYKFLISSLVADQRWGFTKKTLLSPEAELSARYKK